MRSTLKKMGISETDFFRECNTSFKQGAKFARWVTGQQDDFYYHPLMLPEGFSRSRLGTHSGRRIFREARGRALLFGRSLFQEAVS